jgi:hypothetical protein
MLRINLLILFTLMQVMVFSQKKKELKKYGIKTLVVSETSAGKTILDSKVVYNASGFIIEETNYNKEGILKSTTKFKYNKNGDVIEEIEYDEKGILREKRLLKYNGLNEKIEELVLDASEKQLKKIVFTYDVRGFKTEKKVYDANNQLVSTKKMIYSNK